MSYRVFARKYRPQRFKEIVGHSSIIQTLQNAITAQKLAQAYLFVGPRGVGKTSLARIFAKALNCHQGVKSEPCCQCSACLEIAEGYNLDVLEIDGASNNSVESIRTLRENAAFAPARGPYKIYLIDEVHMLTTAAFNALLKTLEEPPGHVKFIFATTEAQKLPATITSRCQRFDLRRLNEEEIADHLLWIAKEEKFELLPQAALALAHGADGALRDAESMLDQLVAFCGKTISQQDVENIFGFTPTDLIHQLGKEILDLNIHGALSILEEQNERGKDLTRLLNDLIYFFRDLLVEVVHPSLKSTTFSLLKNNISREKLLTLLEELGKAEERFKWASNKKLNFDILIIRIIHLLQEVTLSDVLHVLTTLQEKNTLSPSTSGRSLLPKVASEEMKKSSQQPIDSTPRDSESSLMKTSLSLPLFVVEGHESSLTSSANYQEEKKNQISNEVSPHQSVTAITHADQSISTEFCNRPALEDPQQNSKTTINLPSPPWTTIASSLASESPLKFGWLRAGSFVEQKDQQVVVKFPASYQAQVETLFWPQARKKIQERLTEHLGQKIELVTCFHGEEVEEEIIDEPPEKKESVEKKPTNKHSATPVLASSSSAQVNDIPALTPQELENFKNDPLIKKALEIFEAEISSYHALT